MLTAQSKLRRAEISAVVTRADGTVEDLGVIAYRDFTLLGRLRSFINKLKGR